VSKKVLSINDTGQKVAGDLNADDVLNLRYVHTQVVPSDFWEIQHNLNRDVIVQLFNEAGQETEGSVVILDDNLLTVSYVYPLKGTAVII